jgi:hypothetical protein
LTAPIQRCQADSLPPPRAGQAIAGYYGAAGAAATSCPANSYCQAGTERPIACPSGTQSTEVANDVTDCVSSPGFYGQAGKFRDVVSRIDFGSNDQAAV